MSGDVLHNCPRCRFPITGERSPRSHSFLHVVFDLAFDNWPEWHGGIKPDSVDHLRAWLLCHDGVKHRGRLENPTAAQIDELMAIRRHLFVDEQSGALMWPLSLKYAKRGGPQRVEFYQIIDKVLAVIEAETGINVRSLKAEARRELAPNRLGRCA